MANVILPQIITKEQAKESGLKRYFTGKPCKYGHISMRRFCGKCIQCDAEYRENNREKVNAASRKSVRKNPEKYKSMVRKWALENPEKVREKSKKWVNMNPEKAKLNSKKSYKKWRALNPEKKKEKDTRWRRGNPEKQKEAYTRWKKANPEKLRVHNRNREAKKLLVGGSHTEKDIIFLLKTQNYKCLNCGCCVKKARHVDHIMPLALGGNNDRKNLQILCPKCNMSKKTKHPIDWAQENGRLL